MLRIQIRRGKKALNAGHAFNRLQISEFSLFALLRVQAGRLWSFQRKPTEENQGCKLFPGDFNHPAQAGLLCGKREATQPPSSPPPSLNFCDCLAPSWLGGVLKLDTPSPSGLVIPCFPAFSYILASQRHV